MPDLSLYNSPAPYHILSYGTLLGTSFFQSFVGGVVAYKTLTRPQFSQLQQKIFPVYFGIQTGLPIVLALTYPGSKILGTTSGIQGAFAEVNRWSVLIPIGTMFVTSLANMLWIGPETTRVMRERKVQETRDGKKYFEEGPQSNEMQKLNHSFAVMHGVSSLVNMAGFVATIWYGISLAERIQ